MQSNEVATHVKRLAAILAISAVMAFGLVTSPLHAAAGSNGQQLSAFDDANWSAICYYGQNQAGNFPTVCFSLTANVWNKATGYWWVYVVEFGPYYPPGYGGVNVPVHQTDNYYCFEILNYTHPFACNGT